MPSRGLLRVHGQGGVEVELVAQCLADFDRAHDALLVFETTIGNLQRYRYFEPELFLFWNGFPIARPTSRRGVRSAPWIPTSDEISSLVPLKERMILQSVTLASPGFWEFVGSLNPLEVIRKSLNDRHERRKDREYKEGAERKRLELENSLLEGEVLARHITIAKSLGATDRDLAPLLNELVFKPLRALGRHEDQGTIANADVVQKLEDE
jgi:hypothetical protein